LTVRNLLNPDFDFSGRSILVTGGTGSFGRKFIATLVKRSRPRRVVVYSRDELKQYEMAQELSDKEYPFLRYFIGDVRDAPRLEMALSGVEFVVHAAALKQVPTAEYNPFECIHTNVVGAENIVRACIRAGVKRVVALSTDKAANPINLYGASKLASDKIFIAANHLSGAHGPRFAVVRYGNVVGSRGSVLPLFQQRLRENADHLPITHMDMTRFWITLEQGIDFVISVFATMQGGEIFIPKIPSMRVIDLARALSPDTPLKCIGIRPGEKLHELMITEDDAGNTVELEDRYVIKPAFAAWHSDSTIDIEGRPVAERFSYASNTNTEWLMEEDFKAMLRAAGFA
jgi:UDP-N-acetylglucosamine 4,6-dehydratase